MSQAWDVIVVGGGPGGALAAKTCAERGLRTLLIEKREIPRDKCCTGMVMAPWGQDLVEQEFGPYPQDVLKETIYLKGYALHVPGAEVRTLDITTPTTWRHTLDTWMCRQAQEAGADLWDSAQVVEVAQADGVCEVGVREAGKHATVTCEYVIGADGGNSMVRRQVFSELDPLLTYGFRECYDTRLDLPEDRFNIFAGIENHPLFYVHRKSGHTFIEGVGLKGTFEETIARSRRHLVENFGMDPGARPLWRDGCVQAALQMEVASRRFRPASGNVLMVGDAGGMNVPVTGEGLAMSLLSGLDAARAIITARESGETAENLYLALIDRILESFDGLRPTGVQIGEALVSDDRTLYSERLLAGWDVALNVFDRLPARAAAS